VQGLVTVCDADASTGGLVVLPGSHHEHDDLIARSYIAPSCGDFVMLDDADPILEREARLVCARAGDLILWDSRLVHCNAPGVENSEAEAGPAADELIRVCGYVCMTPASFASSDVLERRRAGFAQHASTTHWPHAWVPSGYAPAGTPPLDAATLPAAQRRLIGFDRRPDAAEGGQAEQPPAAAAAEGDAGWRAGDCCALS